eukprot:4097673-Prymnesium_polylepis.1
MSGSYCVSSLNGRASQLSCVVIDCGVGGLSHVLSPPAPEIDNGWSCWADGVTTSSFLPTFCQRLPQLKGDPSTPSVLMGAGEARLWWLLTESSDEPRVETRSAATALVSARREPAALFSAGPSAPITSLRTAPAHRSNDAVGAEGRAAVSCRVTAPPAASKTDKGACDGGDAWWTASASSDGNDATEGTSMNGTVILRRAPNVGGASAARGASGMSRSHSPESAAMLRRLTTSCTA